MGSSSLNRAAAASAAASRKLPPAALPCWQGCSAMAIVVLGQGQPVRCSSTVRWCRNHHHHQRRWRGTLSANSSQSPRFLGTNRAAIVLPGHSTLPHGPAQQSRDSCESICVLGCKGVMLPQSLQCRTQLLMSWQGGVGCCQGLME